MQRHSLRMIRVRFWADFFLPGVVCQPSDDCLKKSRQRMYLTCDAKLRCFPDSYGWFCSEIQSRKKRQENQNPSLAVIFMCKTIIIYFANALCCLKSNEGHH